MTKLGRVLRQNCFKSSEQAFSGTVFVHQKTCVTSVDSRHVSTFTSFGTYRLTCYGRLVHRWGKPTELEQLYTRLEDEFELSERAEILDRKLELVSRTVSTTLDLLQTQRGLRVDGTFLG